VRWTHWFPATALALLLCGGAPADTGKKAVKEESSFGALKGATAEEARAQAETWLKSVGKTDAASKAKFNTIWKADRPLLDRVAETLKLGSPAARRLLTEARDADSPAPTEVPAILKNKKQSAFFRANLALAYARNLANRKVYEEALETLKLFKAEQTVDPASYLFFRAVAEHGLLLKKDANESIARLLDDVPSAAERYKVVAALMHFDMVSWQDKDLSAIARKMDNIQRRLDLARGGKKTQKIQKEVVARLDEIIKELENQDGN